MEGAGRGAHPVQESKGWRSLAPPSNAPTLRSPSALHRSLPTPSVASLRGHSFSRPRPLPLAAFTRKRHSLHSTCKRGEEKATLGPKPFRVYKKSSLNRLPSANASSPAPSVASLQDRCLLRSMLLRLLGRGEAPHPLSCFAPRSLHFPSPPIAAGRVYRETPLYASCVQTRRE